MKVQSLIGGKGDFVATVTQDVTVGDALEALARHDVGALVVSPDGRSLGGILSERDVVRHLHHSGPGVLDHPVSSIMSSDVRTCGPDDTIDDLMDIMTSHRIRHLPVVVDDALAGIISIGDVVKARLAELEDERRALDEYIHAR